MICDYEDVTFQFIISNCVQDVNQARTTCILLDVTPGTYTIEVREPILIYTIDEFEDKM